MTYKLLYICILLLLLLELHKSYGIKCEGFSSMPTDYVLSKTGEYNDSIYIMEDKEELLGVQVPNKERQWNYSYVKAPLGRYIGIYTKKVKDDSETTINTVLVRNTDNSNRVLNILGFNNALVKDNLNTYKYYIKFLSNEQYNKELAEFERIQELKRKHTTCINSYLGTLPKFQAVLKCKNILPQN